MSKESDALSTLSLVHNLQKRLLEAENKLRRGRPGRKPPRRGALMTLILAAVILGPFVCLWGVYLGMAREGSTAKQLFWTVCQEHSSPEAKRQALMDLVALGHGEWGSARLAGLDLGGANLGGARLRSANLQGCDLREARLVSASLMMANLEMVDLSNAQLGKADLRGARLGKHTRMVGADFTDANLRNVSLTSVSASGAKFVSATLRGANCELADFSSADFTDADLRKANFHVTNLRGANLSGARIKGARFEGADLTETNWWRARGVKKHREMLESRFAPKETWPRELREDYERWLSEEKE